jgi:tight adherence protein B
MMLPLVVFAFVVVLVMAVYFAMTKLPDMLATREMDRRLRDVSSPAAEEGTDDGSSVVREEKRGPLPAIDKLLEATPMGHSLKRLIERSGVQTTPSAMVMTAIVGAMVAAFTASLLTDASIALPFAVLAGMAAPFGWMRYKAKRRIRRFEEQFPEALDLLSRAIRAGHAFQTAMGMVASELPEPVGPEFKKTFDQQNWGLPLKDALNELSERIALLDVRFFVTAVLIQRDTGGNLAEILDNLAHVVRERFKILRQVRVHTAHGRFTAYVLLALPAFLSIALMWINPEHMSLLFTEQMGHMMVGLALVLQTVGYFWIRQVIKIEV